MAKIMDGVEVAKKIYGGIEISLNEARKSGYEGKPKLVILMVWNNPSSEIYVQQKIKACKELGFDCEVQHFQENEMKSTADLITKVMELNEDIMVNGIIVQMPLPSFIDKNMVIATVNPRKDVDGLSPVNIGKTFLGVEFEYLTPCTATGVVRMLEFYGVDLIGKKVVVVGSGIVAGRPIAMMLSNRRATVTVCNSKTTNLADYTFDADIVVVAVGVAGLLKASMVKKGVVIVDVGISKDGTGKLHGDVDFEGVSEVAKLISPVPGGVGKLTVACLMENLVKAAIDQWNNK